MEMGVMRVTTEEESHLTHAPENKNRENGTWLNSKGKPQQVVHARSETETNPPPAAGHRGWGDSRVTCD